MRYMRSVATMVAVSFLAGSTLVGQTQGLSVGNYQLVEEERFSRTESYFTYRADVINTGAARGPLAASVTSSVATVVVVPGKGTLTFPPVPAGGRATSTNTFTILVDRTVAFNFASLQWSFLGPIADAGPNQTASIGATVTLNGSRSTNPSGVGTLTYSWAFASRPSGSTATLSNPTSVMPTFVIDVGGNYVITLTVSNGSGTDTANVTISTSNTPPVARAVASQPVSVGSTVTLNGSTSSDVDGDPLTYAWTLTTRPAGSTAVLSSLTAVNPTFTADKAGTYVARLVVNDGKVNSAPATVTITTQNSPPVARAGSGQSGVAVGAVVQLNGSTSTDVDGDALTYQWSLITRPSGSTATLSSSTAVNPTFTADRPGTYIAQLIVNDGEVNSAPATVTITTSAVQAPTANAGPNQTVKHGSQVTLAGSGTDPQSLPLTFLWSLTTKPAGSTAVLSSTTVANPTFTADIPGIYVAQLIVNNGVLSSAPDTVSITTTNTAPVANAGPAQNVTAGALVTLNGSASSDADGDPLTYSWSLISRPSGSTAALSGATSPNPTFVATLAGTYVAQLIVRDGFTNSSPATVTINAQSPGTIVVPGATTVLLGQSAAFAVRLPSAAPAGGVTVNLVSSLPARVAIAPASVVIPAGQTQPAAQPQVTGVGLGAATITASATNYTSGTGTVQVNATVAFTPGSLSIVAGQTRNFTLTLSAPAPAGGVTLNTTSSTPATATVPASVSIAAGGTTATLVVTGVAAGTSVIQAGGANIPNVTANVTVLAALRITTTALTNGRVGTAYSQALAATGGTAPFTWARTVGTLPAGLTLNTATGVISGTPTAAVSNTPLTFRVTDSAATPQTATANLTLTIAAQVPASITATGGTPQSAVVTQPFASRLIATVRDAGNNPVSGVTVTFVAPATGARGTFAGGVNTATTTAAGVATSAVFTANGTIGSYVVSASVAGVATPANFALTNTVGPPASIVATGGTPQSTLVNTAFASRLIATVRDAGGNPRSGVTVTFTVPASGARATFAGGVNTAVTTAAGVATSAALTANATAGSYSVTASVAGVAAPATFALTNVPVSSGPPLTITSASVGRGLQTAISVSIPSPAPAGGVQVNITTNNAAAALVAGRPGDPGTPQVTVTIGEGLQTVGGIFVHGVASSGTAQLTASASGYSSGQSTINLTPSGFVLSGPGGIGVPSFSVPRGTTTTLTVSAARLNANLSFAEVQQIRGNTSATVAISNSTPAVGVVSPTSVTIPEGSTAGTVQFNALATGATTLSAGVPAGFSQPAQGASLTANVTPAGLALSNVTVGQNLETLLNVRLNSPAPAAGLAITITSSDPAKVRFSTTAEDLGQGTLTLNLEGGRTVTPDFYVQGLAASGAVSYSATAAGYGSASATITLAPSGFVLFGPFGPGANFFTTSGAGNTPLTINSALLNADLTFNQIQQVRGGLTVQVPVNSSIPSVGSITVSPLVFTGGEASGTTQFDPASDGNTTISIGVPTGFSTPAQYQSLVASVNTPGLSITDDTPIGKNLQSGGTLLLGQPAPVGGVVVTLTSLSGQLRLSTTETGAGSSSITLTIPSGENNAQYFLQSLGDTGTASYTASASGYQTKTASVPLYPSGVVITGPFGLGNPLLASLSGGPRVVTLFTAILNPGSRAYLANQPLAGGLSLSVALNNSNPAVGTVTTPVAITGGSESGTAQFTPLSVGTTNISVVTPTGYSTPSQFTTLEARVN